MTAVYADASGQDHHAIRILVLAGAIFTALTAIGYVWTISWAHPIPRDATTLVVGRDFLNFWMYGRAAWLPDPSRFYDPHIYNHALAALAGAGYPGQNWSYPPSIMLLAAPFGRLSYMPALLCWTVLGLGIFVWIARRHVDDRRLLIPIMLSPAAIFCLMSGQSSFLTAAMLLTIMACLDRRPVLAGVLIGLLTLKPQLGLLFPVMLVASGRWRVFVAAAVTTLVIIGVTAALFGPQVWIDFVLKGIPIQNLVLMDPQRVGTPFYPTIFMNVRGANASYGIAMAVQACFSAFAAGAVFFAFRYRKNADPQLLTALFFACSICAVPYLLSYDTLAMTCLAVVLLAAGKLDARGQIMAKLAYWLTLIQIGLGQFHIPGPALIPPAFAIFLLAQLKPFGEGETRWVPRWPVRRPRLSA
jgi:Glycosyltransferase family 87